MTAPQFNTWREVQREVLRRIHAREWRPGDAIPNEADLADAFGCARTTVNRALRELAETGLIERRRKAGTRVALQPTRLARLEIPLLRQEVEARGQVHGYALLRRETAEAPPAVAAKMGVSGDFLHVQATHFADGTPFAHEDRWIDPAAAPGAAEEAFDRISANEWLLMHAPFTRGDIAFSAAEATPQVAQALQIPPGTAVFVTDRTTWDHDRAVTTVTQSFAPGYRLKTRI